MKTTINERIKVLRTHLDLTQQEFAALIDFTSTQLSRIENGASAPQNATIKQIFDKIDVSKEWLLDGKGELKAQVITSTLKADPWKDALVSQIKDENNRLQKELERVWQMVQHLTGGAKPNFRKASENAYSFKLLPGMEQLKTISGAMVR